MPFLWSNKKRCRAGLLRCPASDVCSGYGGFLPPGLTVVPFRRVQKFQSEVIQSFGEFSNPAEKVVVADDRGDRYEESCRGSDQRLCNSRPYGPEAGGSCRPQAQEGVHNPPNGSKQTNKRCDASGGREPSEVLF